MAGIRVGALACLLLAACSGAEHPARASANYTVVGFASWYGEELAGNRTASGERFDPARITAAHRTLPLGSLAEVTDVATGRAILVRINDRGPGHRDRVIDLSRGAAHLLGTDRRSVSSVRVRAVAQGREGSITAHGRRPVIMTSSPPTTPSGRYVVQVASYASEARARMLADRLGADVIAAGAIWRVRLGPLDAAKAQRARDAAAARGYADAQLIAID